MKAERFEILPGVMLSYLKTDKFKSSLLTVNLLTQLNRDNASLNALIPSVLLRGSTSYPDMEKINAVSEELYGATVFPMVRRIGEIHCVGLGISFPEEKYLPSGSDEFRLAAEFLGELLCRPLMEKKRFKEEYVESEKLKLRQQLESVKNDKRSYSLLRCIDEMCCFEDYSAGSRGHAEDVELIGVKELSSRYRDLVSQSPAEIFYCGSESADKVCDVLASAFAGMPRGELDYDIGTDIRLNSIEDEARYVNEQTRLNQARLAIGFRLGDSMDWEDNTPLNVFEAIFGGGCNSKLFMNVREKLSLCYEISSILDNKKGLLFVLAGIEDARFDEVKSEIFNQLDAIRRGDVSDEELETAKLTLAADLRSLEDNPGALESYWFSKALYGSEQTPEERVEKILAVGLDDVRRVAENLDCDMIYFLTGSEDEDADEEEADYEA